MCCRGWLKTSWPHKADDRLRQVTVRTALTVCYECLFTLAVRDSVISHVCQEKRDKNIDDVPGHTSSEFMFLPESIRGVNKRGRERESDV
jgi:hypothetical protein